ncbi:hypothetical protein M885DRAFT_511434 [Pelagophyceae sp. CCMP2097]|nr:hypothetical protein M885DRAFT_511434 [Pelagophyceae sp. CCMP2097]|mmetsp:Transcript_2732/g.9681  ORF Transcript_2732/g.9681 Transcript_2732/m.9681 type:complete len:393 (+) Transcript_2732:46-1224(+)
MVPRRVCFVVCLHVASSFAPCRKSPAAMHFGRVPQRRRVAVPSVRLDPDAPVANVFERLPYATLGLVTVLWGSQHAVIKFAEAEDGGGAAALTAARFAIAAACLAPWAPTDSTTWRRGAELGLLAFCGFACQAVGLETTTATRSAFLLYLNVKLVPLCLWGLEGVRPTPAVLASAFTALAGTALLVADASPGGAPLGLCVGDAWSVAAALASALFIVRLGKLGTSDVSAAGLTAASAWTTAALAAAWYGATAWSADDFSWTADFVAPQVSTNFILAALYLGAVPSALCGYLQTLAQRQVPASRAAIIYATDPLWAALFASAFLGEALGPRGFAGAGLIAAAVFAQRAFDYRGEYDADATDAELIELVNRDLDPTDALKIESQKSDAEQSARR